MIKKIISLVLTVVMLITLVPMVFASDELVTIEAENYDKCFEDNNNGQYSNNLVLSNKLQLERGDWAEYTLNVNSTGTYEFTLKGMIATARTITFQRVAYASTDDTNPTLSDIGSLTVPKHGDMYTTIKNGNTVLLVLNKGENIIRFKVADTISNALILNNFTYRRIGSEHLQKIEAEKFTDVNGNTASTTYASIAESAYLKHNLTIGRAGEYKITLRAANISDALVNLSLNAIPLARINVVPSGNSDSFCDTVYYTKLEEGTKELKITAAHGSLKLDSIEFEFVADLTESQKANLVSAMNSAENGTQVSNILEQYEDSLCIDFSAETDGIFYKTAVFDELAKRSYEDVNEIVATFLKSVAKPPVIMMKEGNVAISALESGDLTFYISTDRLYKAMTVVGAIYKNIDKDGTNYKMLHKAKMIDYTNQEIIEMPFENVVISDTESYTFKVFYINNLNQLTPYDLYQDTFKEIYVAPSGSDSDDGTEEHPLQTFKAAADMVKGYTSKMTGDIVVNFTQGEYFIDDTIELTSEHSGQNGYDVIFKGIGDTKPLIHGGQKVTGWSQVAGKGYYKATLDSATKARNLYVNGTAAVVARSENVFSYDEEYADPATEQNVDGILTKSIPDYNFAKPDDLEMVFEVLWSCQRIGVDSVTKTADGTVFKPDNGGILDTAKVTVSNTPVSKGKTFFLENAMELLDAPGEFYHDVSADTIYYYPYQGETLDDTYVAKTEFLFNIGNTTNAKTNNIIFDNLDIRYGAWNETTDNGFLSLQADYMFNLTGTGSKQVPAQIAINNASGIEIKNCAISCMGSNSISMEHSVTDSKVTQNVIKDTSGAAVTVGTWLHSPTQKPEYMCKNIDIKNNVIRRTSQEYRGTAAIAVYYENGVNICHNDIADLPYTGITVGWGWGGTTDSATDGHHTICHNKISDVMNCLKDGSQIYTLGSLHDTAVFENYTEDSEYVASGIYTDSGSAYMKIFNNVFYEATKNSAKDEYWWNQGVENTHDLIAYSNYVSEHMTVNRTYKKDKDGNPILDASGQIQYYNDEDTNTTKITASNYPQAAQNIKAAAGVETAYSSLLENTNLPSYKPSIVKTSPNRLWADGYLIYASEAVAGYDKSNGLGLNPDLITANYASFNGGDWLEYDLSDIPQGRYQLIMYAFNGNASILNTSRVTISLNGKTHSTVTFTPNEGVWSGTTGTVINNVFELTGNADKIKFANRQNGGLHFYRFVLKKVE